MVSCGYPKLFLCPLLNNHHWWKVNNRLLKELVKNYDFFKNECELKGLKCILVCQIEALLKSNKYKYKYKYIVTAILSIKVQYKGCWFEFVCLAWFLSTLFSRFDISPCPFCCKCDVLLATTVYFFLLFFLPLHRLPGSRWKNLNRFPNIIELEFLVTSWKQKDPWCSLTIKKNCPLSPFSNYDHTPLSSQFYFMCK